LLELVSEKKQQRALGTEMPFHFGVNQMEDALQLGSLVSQTLYPIAVWGNWA